MIGGARSVWQDFERALDFGPYEAVYVVNTMIMCWPGRITAVSLHPEKMRHWLMTRSERGLPEPDDDVAHDCSQATNYYPRSIVNLKTHGLQKMSLGVSSGIYASMVAAIRGHRSVLCGVPMRASEAHHYDQETPWHQVEGFLREMRARADRLRVHTRSVSGYTRELFGEPTREWTSGDL